MSDHAKAEGASPREAEVTAEKSYVEQNAEVARGFQAAPIAGALFAANIGVFVAQIILSGNWRYALGMPEPILRWLGGNASLWTIADNRFETLVTSCFIHGSILHLGVNMFLLWQVGPLLERAVGSARFFTLFLGAGIVGSAASAIWGRFFGETLSVGASGALCGLIAAAMVVGIRTEGWRSELAIAMARWLALILLIGIIRSFNRTIAQIDNAAHIGGALGGAIVAITWQRGITYSRRAEQAIIAACVGIILASGAVIYLRNRSDPYLFLDHDGRMKAALDALHDGRCDQARTAMQRAIQMDPNNRSIRALGEEINRECSDPSSATPVPQIRR